jgi:hypothetical protein
MAFVRMTTAILVVGATIAAGALVQALRIGLRGDRAPLLLISGLFGAGVLLAAFTVVVRLLNIE